MDNNKDLNLDVITQKLTRLSDDEFLGLGAGGLSYIKPIDHQESYDLYALHGADGSHIATGQDADVLHVIARQNNLIPMTVQ